MKRSNRIFWALVILVMPVAGRAGESFKAQHNLSISLDSLLTAPNTLSISHRRIYLECELYIDYTPHLFNPGDPGPVHPPIYWTTIWIRVTRSKPKTLHLEISHVYLVDGREIWQPSGPFISDKNLEANILAKVQFSGPAKVNEVTTVVSLVDSKGRTYLLKGKTFVTMAPC